MVRASHAAPAHSSARAPPFAPALALALALLAAGCVSPDIPALLRRSSAEPTDWEIAEEPSMAPDFRGMGETYPVLVVHTHHVPSARQQEEARRNPVVCLDLDGAPMPFAERSAADAPAAERSADTMASAPCMGPAADPATGRLFVDRASFDAARPRAVAVLMGSCDGGAIHLGDEREFIVSLPGHDFHVRSHEDGTFSVDKMPVQPGTSLKFGYFLHRGDAKDEEYVRTVFDAPGGWLVSRVGMSDPGAPPLPPRPELGTGLMVDVPLAPATLIEPLGAVLAATPGEVLGIAAMRAVHDGERLTELTIRFVTEGGAVTWYGAGRTGDAMRLLGAEEPGAAAEPALAMDDVRAAFDREWLALRAGADGATIDARLAPEIAWGALGVVPLGLPELAEDPCEGECVYVRMQDAWARMPAPEQMPADAALTLGVTVFSADASTQVWWHVPQGSSAVPRG